MRCMMLLILGTSSRYEVVQGLHLRGHVLHLFVDNADRLLMDGLGSILDRGVALIDSLEASRLAHASASSNVGARTVQSFFILPLRVSLDLRTSSTTEASLLNHTSMLSL